MAIAPNNIGTFIPTTNVWDVDQLQGIDTNSSQFVELFVRLYQNINNIANALNIKDTGIYNTFEITNGQQFFPNPSLNSSTSGYPIFRQVYRTVVNFGPLPNTGTASAPHHITVTPKTTFTRIYGVANNTTGNLYLPLPYAAQPPSQNIDLYVDATNVNIVTGADETAFTITYVVLEYLQS